MKFGFTYMPDETNAYHDSSGNGSGTFTYQGTYNAQGGSTVVPTAAEGFCYKGSGSAGSGKQLRQHLRIIGKFSDESAAQLLSVSR